MADIIDQANDRAERDLALALQASKSRLRTVYARLHPDRTCHNCGEPLEDGCALFCEYAVPGEGRSACAIDFDRRHGVAG